MQKNTRCFSFRILLKRNPTLAATMRFPGSNTKYAFAAGSSLEELTLQSCSTRPLARKRRGLGSGKGENSREGIKGERKEREGRKYSPK